MLSTNPIKKSIVTLSVLLTASICETSSFQLPNYHFDKDQQFELIGNKRHPQSQIKISNVSNLVYSSVFALLPQKHKSLALRISRSILKESFHSKLDPLFVLSVIHHESKMNPDAVGSVGEIGLMQIRPETAQWLNNKYKITNDLNLKKPETNIQIGVFFINQLRSKFKGNSQLYISAYNMGIANVLKNLKKNKKPKIYANKVMQHYLHYRYDLQMSEISSSNERSTNVAFN